MEKYVFLNSWAMRIIGVWYPAKISSFELKIYAFLRALTISSVLFILIPAAIVVQDHLRQSSLSSGVEILALLLSSTLILCKTINIVLRREKIRILLNEMSVFWQDARASELKSMTGFAEIGKNLTKWYFALGFFNIVSFAGQPIVDSYITGFQNSSTIVNRLPFDGWENFMAVYHPASIIVLVYFCHVIAVIMGTVASIGHDCLFVVLILHVCANLRGITTSLKLFDNFNERDQSVEANIVRCAKTFQNLIDYTKGLENMLSLFLLAQSICSSFIICLTSFLVSRDLQANKEIFKYIAFWAGALFQLFIFCWAANCLQTESNEVGRSAYEAYGKLMNLDLKNHHHHRHLLTKTPVYLQMILVRSQTPPKITAGNFYALSLEKYKNVLSTSYSYFTILRAFSDNKTN